MHIRIALAAAAFAAAAVSGPAAALTCYFVIDRNDNVVYRDTFPPIDLSDQGAAEREQMRRRGEHLVSMESDRCPSIEFFTGSAGSANLNVDQVVAGIPVRKGEGAPDGATVAPSPGKAAPRRAPARAPGS